MFTMIIKPRITLVAKGAGFSYVEFGYDLHCNYLGKTVTYLPILAHHAHHRSFSIGKDMLRCCFFEIWLHHIKCLNLLIYNETLVYL